MDISPEKTLTGVYNTFNKRLAINNPMILVILTIVIIFYFFIFQNLGTKVATPMPETPGMTLIEILMWAFFIFLILINGLQYFFSLDIKTTIKDIFAPVPEIKIAVKDERPKPPKLPTAKPPPVPEIMIEKQVFNIPDNKYTYDDAKALCSAYDADLATYGQIEAAYKKGAEWCNYGWSDKQMIFYPTQKATYDKLQTISGHEHDCGRTGINGGYIANASANFGVNCFGYKPEITGKEQSILGASPVFPMSAAEKRFQKKVSKFRKKVPSINVSPFNSNTWSQI